MWSQDYIRLIKGLSPNTDNHLGWHIQVGKDGILGEIYLVINGVRLKDLPIGGP